jgi:anthranilate phosphoribosyltransferase
VDLKRDSGTPDADALYAAIIAAHSGLSHEDSVALNARLVLLLANHIGDADVLREAIAAARASLDASNRRPTGESE